MGRGPGFRRDDKRGSCEEDDAFGECGVRDGVPAFAGMTKEALW